MGSGVSPDITSPTKPIAAAKRRVTFKNRTPPLGGGRQIFVVHVVAVNLHSPYFEQTSVCSRYILSARSVNIVTHRLTCDRDSKTYVRRSPVGMTRSLTVSTALLNIFLCVHMRPINPVVFRGSLILKNMHYSSLGGLPA